MPSSFRARGARSGGLPTELPNCMSRADTASNRARPLHNHCGVRYSSCRNLRSRAGGRKAAARLTAQDRVEAHPAQVMAARFLVADRDTADIASQNRPDSSDHGMASLPIGEEIVQELTQH